MEKIKMESKRVNDVNGVNWESASITNTIYLEYAETASGKVPAVYFRGDGFGAESAKDLIKVWKKVVLTHWIVKLAERGYKVDNAGISTTLRSSCPQAIHFYGPAGYVASFKLSNSIWQNVGMCPTAKECEKLAVLSPRELKERVHKAAVASWKALHFDLTASIEAGKVVEKE